uniref:Uncharacterized protein n=1 Tax=Timema shepardi TaxID=629360 RepID=A0A7R9G788_TIMSH|nr:unnamed protein product [Timema shepardi]
MLMSDANGGLSTKSDSDPLYEDYWRAAHLLTYMLGPASSLIGKHNLPVILELDDNNSTAGSSTESRRQTPSATFKQAASSVNSKKFASMADAKKDLAILQMELLKREYKIREAHMVEIHELDVKIKRAQLEILLDQKKVDVARL